MPSESHDPGSDSICDQPVSLISDADMDGIAVAAANIVVNLCFRIMVTWSPENVDMGIQSLLFQIYPILLSTLLSINRQQLSTLDAQFAVEVSSSPLMVYLVVASIGDLIGIKTGLYKRIKSHRTIVRALGAIVLPLWAGLTMTWMSGKAFKDSSCDKTDFKTWLLDLWCIIGGSVVYPGFLADSIGVYSLVVFLPVPFFLFKCRRQMEAGLATYKRGLSGPWALMVFFTPLGWFRLIFEIAKCAWCAIDHNYKWYIYILFGYFDISWAYELIRLSILATGEGYVMSYAQVSSLLAVIPTLFVTSKFIYSCRWDILNFLRRLPNQCLVGVRRCFSRKKLDLPAQDRHLPFSVASCPEKPTVGKLPDQMAKNLQSTHRLPLSPGLDYEMQAIWAQDMRCLACGAIPENAACGRN